MNRRGDFDWLTMFIFSLMALVVAAAIAYGVMKTIL